MKSRIGKDLLIWARVLLTVIIGSLVGIYMTTHVAPNHELFMKFVWIFIITSMIFTGLLMVVTRRILRDDVEDDEISLFH